ncbi:hypothetical protein AB0G83_05900 [Streptomyces klenkii]|uniref:hypothetical protein n=1 Tax=Streptomyces klenkii TaxID=1420899 RepID=UPI0033F0EC93
MPMSEKLRIVGLEEHVVLPVLLDAWAKAGVPQIPQLGFGDAPIARRLRDVGEQRLADMDDQGVDVAVLSLATSGVQNLKPADAPEFDGLYATAERLRVQAPFTDVEKAAIGSGNWERLTGHAG